jgi:hypothetical protein
MESFRRNSKAQTFVTLKGDVVHAYLGYNIVDIQKYLMGIASLIKEMSGKSASVLHTTLIKKFYAQEIIMLTRSVKSSYKS